ncbi:MAG: ABC transporter substrate-binding protein, partial [Mycobacteriales bacterium]
TGGGTTTGGFGGSTSGGTSSTSGTAGSPAQVGPGVSTTEILVGRTRGTNSEAANKAFGNSVSPAPEDQYDKAMVDYINSHGGVAGRKIKLNYYTVDYTANKSAEQIQSEQCAQWTQDNKVFAVLTGSQDQLRGCLAKKGVPQVYENVFSNSDGQTFDTFRSYYEINGISLSNLGTALPAQLAQGGYFKRGAKYGLLAFDGNPVQRAVSKQLEPALASFGVKLDQKAYVKTPQTASEQGDSIASLPGFVLAMKNAGVDHIIIFGDGGGALLAYFSRNAASQGYHPAYGVTSASAPQALIDTGNVDPDELKGAVTGGWNPSGDVGIRPYTKYGAGYQLCASIMAEAGVPFNGSSNNTVVGSKTCDAFFFFAAAVNRGAPDVTRDSFLRGAESLGTSYVSALTYSASIAAATRDGVSTLATSVYDGSCTCFTYKGDLRRIR